MCQMNELTVFCKAWHWHIAFSNGDLLTMTSWGVYLALSACVIQCVVSLVGSRAVKSHRQ